MRSGRMRSAWRSSCDIVTSPLPSALARRETTLTQCGWCGESSAVSSITRMRSRSETVPKSAESRVVLPEPVPPMTRKEIRLSTTARSSAAMSSGSVPLSTSWGRVVCAWRSTRRLRQVPATAGGLSKAWTRSTTPSGRVTRPSAKGCASSRRVPEAAASRLASWRTSASSRKVISVRSRPSPRSMNTACGPLTTTSVTPSRPSTASSGPNPVASWRRRRSRSSTATSLITPASARMRRARAAASCTTSGSAAMMRCIFSSVSCAALCSLMRRPPRGPRGRPCARVRGGAAAGRRFLPRG